MASEWRPHVRLAIPLATQQLGFQLMGLVDAAMLGHYNDTGLAAAGIGNNVLFTITSIGMGVVMGTDTVVPQALGAGRRDDARRAFGAGLRIALLLGLASMLAALATPWLLRLATVDPAVAADARVYTLARSFGAVPFLVMIAQRSYLAAHDVTRPLIIAVIAGNIANAGLDLVLIFGVGPIPGFGVLGAAVATVTVQLITVAIYFAGVRAVDGPSPRPASTRADLAEVVRYGGPVAGHLFAEIGVFSLSTLLAAHLGNLPAGAHTIALNVSSLTFSIALGVGAATSVRVGHAIGAGDVALARRRGFLGLVIGMVVMGSSALVFVALPRSLAQLFTDQPAMAVAAVPLIRIAALFQLSDGAQAIGAGALRGIGDTRATFIANLVGHYAIGLPISLALGFGVGLGAPGLWWGLSAGLTATAVFLVLRFRSRTARYPAAT